jgi:ribonuclease VapC
MADPARSSLVVDTSAAVAVILAEPGSGELATHLEDALVRLMPAAIRVELGIVIETRLHPAGQDVIDRFRRDAKVDIVPVDADLADRAMSGWRRYGRGRHPAGLNFGDCFTYALADRTGHPVLCTCNDFAATDITVVRPGTEQTGPPDPKNGPQLGARQRTPTIRDSSKSRAVFSLVRVL